MASTKRCEGGETVHKAQGESQAAEGGLRPAHAGGKRGAGEKPVNRGGGMSLRRASAAPCGRGPRGGGEEGGEIPKLRLIRARGLMKSNFCGAFPTCAEGLMCLN